MSSINGGCATQSALMFITFDTRLSELNMTRRVFSLMYLEFVETFSLDMKLFSSLTFVTGTLVVWAGVGVPHVRFN